MTRFTEACLIFFQANQTREKNQWLSKNDLEEIRGEVKDKMKEILDDQNIKVCD
jgi:hypothetical protein